MITNFSSILLAGVIAFSAIGISYLKEVCLPCGYNNISAIWMFQVDNKSQVDDCQEHEKCCGEVNDCNQKQESITDHETCCCGNHDEENADHQHKKEILSYQFKFETPVSNNNEIKIFNWPILSLLQPEPELAYPEIVEMRFPYYPKIPPDISSGREIHCLISSLNI